MAIFSNRVLLTLVAVATGLTAAWSPGQGRGFRPARRRHGRLPRRQHHRRPDLRQDHRELHAAPLPRAQGPVHQRRLGRRHGRRRTGAARPRCLRPRRDRADRRLRRQRHRLGRRRPTTSTGRLYLDSVRGIVEHCKKRKVRVFICSAAITGRGSRHGRGRLPPEDVRRGHGHRPRSGRTGPSTSSAPCGRSSGGVLAANAAAKPTKDKPTPSRRRRHPPQRPRPTRDGASPSSRAWRAGRRLVGRRSTPAGPHWIRPKGCKVTDVDGRASGSSSTGSTRACRSTSGSSAPSSSASSRFRTN